MVNWVPIVAATTAAIPAAVIFFAAYGRYDGAFRDNVVFLYFIGGLAVGGLLGFLTLLLFSTNALLIAVIGLALLYPIALVATINRRKWQGERHAVFNGGAAGLGVAVMMSFSVTFFLLMQPMRAAQEAANAALREATGNPDAIAPAVDSIPFAFNIVALQGLALAVGLAGIFFGLGLLAGDAVRRRKQFVTALLGAAAVLAPTIFLEEFERSGAWLWLILLGAYGIIFAIAAEKRLMHEGLTEEAKRERRRRRRAAL